MSSLATAAPRAGTSRLSAILAAGSGHVLEWFDFAAYGFFAAVIGHRFFPATSETASLLSSFAAFGVGFVARPLGGLTLGRRGDTRGRKETMLVTMAVMACATLGLGLLPDYGSIGILAPILLVLLRLVQGFSLGAEWALAGTFMVEWAPPERRGLYGSLHQVSGSAGLLLGSLAAAGLSTLMSQQAVEAWGWRIPFLLGAVLGPLSLLLRRRLAETPVFLDRPAAERERRADGERPRLVRNAACACGLAIAWAVLFYTFLTFMPSFSQRQLGMSSSAAFWSNAVGISANILAIPLCGLLSDRFGRRPVLMFGCASFAVLTYPTFAFLLDRPSIEALVLCQILFGLLLAGVAGVGTAALVELFPTRVRSTWLAATYSISVAVAGGFAPFIAVLMIQVTGSSIAPTLYVIAASLIGCAAVYLMSESADRSLS